MEEDCTGKSLEDKFEKNSSFFDGVPAWFPGVGLPRAYRNFQETNELTRQGDDFVQELGMTAVNYLKFGAVCVENLVVVGSLAYFCSLMLEKYNNILKVIC